MHTFMISRIAREMHKEPMVKKFFILFLHRPSWAKDIFFIIYKHKPNRNWINFPCFFNAKFEFSETYWEERWTLNVVDVWLCSKFACDFLERTGKNWQICFVFFFTSIICRSKTILLKIGMWLCRYITAQKLKFFC